MSAAIYYWTHARHYGIFLLNNSLKTTTIFTVILLSHNKLGFNIMNEFNIICHDHHLSDLYWSETELFLEDYNQAAVTREMFFCQL